MGSPAGDPAQASLSTVFEKTDHVGVRNAFEAPLGEVGSPAGTCRGWSVFGGWGPVKGPPAAYLGVSGSSIAVARMRGALHRC